MLPCINFIQIVLFSFLVFISSFGRPELYSSLSTIEPLLTTHRKTVDSLKTYILKEKRRINTIKTLIKRYKTEHEKMKKDFDNYVANPFNAFTLLKRLTSDFELIQLHIRNQTEYVKDSTWKYPSQGDLVGAVDALERLQSVYRLNITHLAEGKIIGNFSQERWLYTEYGTPMSVSDCYEIGRILNLERKFLPSIAWMLEALYKYKSTALDSHRILREDIIGTIGEILHEMDREESALEWSNLLSRKETLSKHKVFKIKALVRKYRGLLGITYQYKWNMEEQENKERRKPPGSKRTIGEAMNLFDFHCRGEGEVPGYILNRLQCRYLIETHPFLRLAPVKMEQLYLNPDIYLLHEVITEREMKQIKEIAKKKLTGTYICTNNSVKVKDAVTAAGRQRISKITWIRDDEDKVAARLTRRVNQITGFDMTSSEELHVANYGVGGHFVPHCDYLSEANPDAVKLSGDRTATMIFYLSTVLQGGATVFPDLGVTVYPKKGSALNFLNLDPSGNGNRATVHAACPVLRGSKWVANKWIHQVGQELIAPCPADYEANTDLFNKRM